MSPTPLPLEKVLDLLAGAPRRLAALMDEVPSAPLHAAPGSGEWSANEVLAHLRSCADVWGSCIATILAEDRPTIRAMNPRTWIRQTNYLESEFHASLHAFIAQRAGLLAVLQGLPQEDWSRAATVTGAGKTLKRTVLSYAEWLATHERPHVKQIERIVKALHK